MLRIVLIVETLLTLTPQLLCDETLVLALVWNCMTQKVLRSHMDTFFLGLFKKPI